MKRARQRQRCSRSYREGEVRAFEAQENKEREAALKYAV